MCWRGVGTMDMEGSLTAPDQTLLAPLFGDITSRLRGAGLLHVHVPWPVLVLCRLRPEDESAKRVWPSSSGIELLEKEEGQKALCDVNESWDYRKNGSGHSLLCRGKL